MKHYETIVIMDPDLAEEERPPLLDRFEEIMTQMGGALLQMDHWGMKKFAYEIKKKSRGYYLRIDYGAEGSVVDEIERFCRIDDRVLKYMTVLQAETVDVEKLRAEMAAAEAKKAPVVPQETPAAEEAAPVVPQETPTAEQPVPEAAMVESAGGETTQTEPQSGKDETKREESE